MKTILLFLITFSISCKIQNPNDGSERMMSMTMDLSSIHLSESYRVTPAVFETVTTEITLVEEIVKEGFYEEEKHTILTKDSYKSIKLVPKQEFIIHKLDTLLILHAIEESLTPEQIKEYSTFKYCASCDQTTGLRYSQVLKSLGPGNAIVGLSIKTSHNRMKLVQNAKFAPVYSENNKTITATGTKSELKQFLAHPKLEGVKYKMRKS